MYIFAEMEKFGDYHNVNISRDLCLLTLKNDLIIRRASPDVECGSKHSITHYRL
jgi:hypothetical protein